MSEADLILLLERKNVSTTRQKLAAWIESRRVQTFVIIAILLNAIVLGMETSPSIMASFSTALITIDKLCLVVFVIELIIKMFCYRLFFFRSGWNIFDFFVVGIALVPGAGVWAVLRSLRVLRVLRLLTAIPSLKKVVAAFIHAIPGLSGVMTVMSIFFYTMGVLATKLFGASHPEWFGTLGASLYTLFQVMTLESWSMGIVRPVMETHPWAFAFFVPFIIIATFTILNLFIGIIVSTMQELSLAPEIQTHTDPELVTLLERIDTDLRALRKQIEKKP
ncbi:MAG: ion transporter [Akkermansiaceae bacterium]|jgi:voltage-gated sodium channel|nr:ion transporter [Akkermansiaceae bacterium]MDP4646601.1 ion transporter [Akkermansiaceae bacterium]MDP4720200.1 ion transporter [Akkermansiaceae bacterium]MDP4779810.1 ion transporter [Akkermansiaceae bacterium]MDP4846402.1 ion transporter [Akkermansiaceae bacterium]